VIMMFCEGEERLLYQCRWGYTGVGGAEIRPSGGCFERSAISAPSETTITQWRDLSSVCAKVCRTDNLIGTVMFMIYCS
jgi:hypothetical protein